MKINNKSELCLIINETISIFRENRIEINLSEMIGNATNLEKAVENSMFCIVDNLNKLPVMKKIKLEYKFGDYLRSNLNIQEMHNYCKNMHNITLADYEIKLSKMNKLELQLELNKLNLAIKYYFVVSSVRNINTYISFYRTMREYLEMYISDFDFLVKEKRIEIFEKEINLKIDNCIKTIPNNLIYDKLNYGEIDKTFIEILDKNKNQIYIIKSSKNEILNYEEILKLIKNEINHSDFEIIKIMLFSKPYVVRNLETDIILDYYKECRKKFKIC